MRVLITGAGMLGGALAAEAQARGNEVLLLSRELLDVTDAAAVANTIHGYGPHLIFHTAALTKVNYCEEHPDEAMAVNAQGTANVATAAADAGAQLIYFSTDYVFPGSREEPILEEAAPVPLNAYGASKLAGERHVAGYQGGHIVRISGVFGARPDHSERNFFRAIFDKVTQTEAQIEVVDDQFTAVSYAPHIAQMLFQLLDIGLPKVVHLTSAGENSWHGWARVLARAAGADEARIVPVPSDISSPVRRPRDSVLGTGHKSAGKLISQHPATKGIAAYVQQLKQG